MTHRHVWALALVLSSGWLPTTSAGDLPVRVERDIPYAKVDDRPLLLDVAIPTTPGPHPGVVCLHGGAWRGGNKNDLSRAMLSADLDFGTGSRSLIEWMAGRGFVAASVGYRLAPKNKFPAQLQDTKTAVRYLKANAAKFAIDPTRLAALGFSAGGHLAALLGTTDSSAGFDGELFREQTSTVRCVVDFFGPSDLTLYVESEPIERAFMSPFLGARFADRPNLYKQASPIEHVSKNDPPFLLLHGTADLIVPVIHSERLHDRLRAAGVSSELVTIAGKGHGWTGPQAVDSMNRVAAFLSRELKGTR